jgi:hypothetical protein
MSVFRVSTFGQAWRVSISVVLGQGWLKGADLREKSHGAHEEAFGEVRSKLASGR